MDRRGFIAVAGSTLLAGCPTLTDSAGENDRTDSPEGARTERRGPTRVNSLEALLEAVEAAEPGDVVAVDPGAEIDLSGVWNVTIPAGVTLQGGRGPDGAPGALVYSTEGDEGRRNRSPQEKFRLGEGARFTGFRLRGHHHEYVNPWEELDGDYLAHRGGGVRVGAGGVVDNNEISGWPHAAVAAERDAHVHNNFLHHNTWEGLGYGVTVPDGDNMPVIEFNRFNYNRHSINCLGGPQAGYVARYNLVGEDWVGHQFDVHGSEGMTGVAGDEIVIHNNTFRGTRAVQAKTRDPGGEYPAIHVRGLPETGVWIERNWFYHDSREAAYEQPDGPRRASFSNNHYGPDEPRSPLVGVPEFRPSAIGRFLGPPGRLRR